MSSLKYLIIGIMIGASIIGIAWAATGIILQSSDGIAISASNPLPIQLN